MVKAFEPPTVSCVSNPSTVISGDSSTITATGISPQNRPLTYSYSSASGSVSGTGSTATLTTTGAPTGAITVTCNVVDDKSQTASAQPGDGCHSRRGAEADDQRTVPMSASTRDARRPARVDNEAKACLDEVALNLAAQLRCHAGPGWERGQRRRRRQETRR